MNLDQIVLSRGAHDTPEEGTCLVWAVQFWEIVGQGTPHDG